MSNAIPNTRKNVRSRVIGYTVVVFLIGLVIAAAYYQEQIGYYFGLHLWNKSAPGQAVSEFLTAVKQGDRQKADSYLGEKSYKPLMKDGKWIGYFIVSQAGTLNFQADEIAGANVTPTETEFVLQGKGAAMVTVPDAQGKPAPYRLELQEGGWKIMEMRGGKPAPKPAAPSGPQRNPFGGAPGSRPAGGPPGGRPAGGAPGAPHYGGPPGGKPAGGPPTSQSGDTKNATP